MTFLKQLIEVESCEPLNYNNKFVRWFKPIIVNEDIKLSIQASYCHYCNPRQTLSDISDYYTMEMAILKRDEFVSVNEVTDNKILIEQFANYYDETIYGFVPVDLIEELYIDLLTQMINSSSNNNYVVDLRKKRSMEDIFNDFVDLQYTVRNLGSIVQNEGITVTDEQLNEWIGLVNSSIDKLNLLKADVELLFK